MQVNHFHYLLLMAGCLLITLPLEFIFSARVYRRAKLAGLALLPAVVVFSIWDVAGIVLEHWSYNEKFVTGFKLGIMPIEELVFFIVIPICALLSYEAVGTGLGWLRRGRVKAGEAS